MEALIRPEFGLMFWTIACFVLLALVLSKTAWRPLMQAVEAVSYTHLTLPTIYSV